MNLIKEINKLQLAPTDILVVTVAHAAWSTARKRCPRIHAEIRKILPPGQRSIVKLEDVKLDRLADIITPEELHALNVAMEKKLLAQPTAGLPQQTRG